MLWTTPLIYVVGDMLCTTSKIYVVGNTCVTHNICAIEFVDSFVCACACLVSFCLCVSRTNLLVFTVVVVSVCLLRDHTHTLVSTRALERTLTFAHIIVCYTWFCHLSAPSVS